MLVGEIEIDVEGFKTTFESLTEEQKKEVLGNVAAYYSSGYFYYPSDLVIECLVDIDAVKKQLNKVKETQE
jgi:hypothetical protein